MNGRLKESQLLLGLLAILMLVTSVVLFAQQIPPTNLDISKGQTEGSRPQDSFIPSYITHSPITITSNTDFVSQSFPGSGTAEDPYVIEGYNITTTGTCISIQDTDAYFVIRDCLLTGGASGKGVRLDDVDHGEIRNNTISGTDDCGVYLRYSLDNTVVNNTFSGNNNSVFIVFSSNNNTVMNNTISGNYRFGVFIGYSSNNNTVANNTISGSDYCVCITSSSYNTVVNNTISTNSKTGVRIESSSYNTVMDNTISGNYYGVRIESSSYNTVVDNTISGNRFGMYIYFSSYNTVVNNTISGSDSAGISLEFSSDNTLASNIFVNNGIRMFGSEEAHWRQNITTNNLVNGKILGYFWKWTSGTIDVTQYGQVILADCTGVTVENGVFSNASVGITLGLSSYCSLMNNTISGNDIGVYIIASSYNTLVNNTIWENGQGVWLQLSSSNNIVMNNTISGNSNGVSLYSSSENTVVDNTISGNEFHAVIIDHSSENTVVDNTIAESDYGVILSSSSNNTIVNNTIAESDRGVVLVYSSDNTLSSNIMVNNGVLISGNAVEYWRHNITTDNLVNGKQLGYFWNCTGGVIDGTQYGQVILANCTGVTVKDGVLSNGSVGIELGFSSYCSLMNNTLYGNYEGVVLISSSNNVVVNNTVSGNSNGVSLYSSSENTVVDNTISGHDYYGVYIRSSSENTVVDNTISENDHGVGLSSSSYNTVMNNTISGNYFGVSMASSSDNNTLVNNTISGNYYGVYLHPSSDNNLIYLNVIADSNYENACDYGTGNHWNSTVAGNYWSDYTGTGVYHVPGSAGSIDYYPFIYPPDTSPPTIDQPLDVEYGEGTDGHSIMWSPNDFHPSHYVVYRNGTEIASASWDGNSIIVEVDGLSVGLYNYTIVVYDTSGYWISDIVFVTVVDTIAPTIDQPADMEYDEGTTGNTIEWNPSDTHPSLYVVYRNSTEVVSDNWDGSSITINVDGLSVGIYNYTIVVYDTYENWVSDTVIVTVYDISPPTIDQPLDVEYREGTDAHSIMWSPSDTHPSHYVVYRDGTEVASDSWDGSSISVNVDGLGVGVYNYTIVVYDTSGNWVSDTVFVTVIEITPPTIDQPADMNHEEGMTGNTITWTPSDAHPSRYVVYQNGTQVVSDSWDGSSITVEVDGLSVGVYNYTIVVHDTSGNWASDTVLVTVLPQASTTTTTTTSTTITDGDVTGLVILFLSVGGIGVVVVVLILMRHRRGSMTGS